MHFDRLALSAIQCFKLTLREFFDFVVVLNKYRRCNKQKTSQPTAANVLPRWIIIETKDRWIICVRLQIANLARCSAPIRSYMMLLMLRLLLLGEIVKHSHIHSKLQICVPRRSVEMHRSEPNDVRLCRCSAHGWTINLYCESFDLIIGSANILIGSHNWLICSAEISRGEHTYFLVCDLGLCNVCIGQ